MAKKKSKKSKKQKANIFSNLLMFFCICAILFSGWKLFGYVKGYKDGADEYQQLRDYIEEEPQKKTEAKGEDNKEKKDKCPIKVDFESLKKINSDVVGWIYIKDSGINYPIVQSKTKGNEYYLHHTFEKKNNFSGAIFLDEFCESDFSMDNSVIYGHNLKNGQMFGHLKKMYDTNYNKDANYKNYPIIWILTPDKTTEYAVYAGREINSRTQKSVYTIQFSTGEEYQEYLKNAKKNSLFKTDVDVEEGLILRPSITLSTCTSTTEAGRFIVQAIQIQEIDEKQ